MAEANHTTCAQCGVVIEPEQKRGRKRKYCSALCRSRYLYRNYYSKARTKKRQDTIVCAMCGVECKQRPTGTGKKYCSKKCSDRVLYLASEYKYKKKQSVRKCKACGVLFLRMPGRGYAYCSDACTPLTDRTHYRQDRTICVCVRCNQPFIPASVRGSGVICRSCYGRSKATCLQCGTEYLTTPSSYGKFCSRKCNMSANRHRVSRIQQDKCRERNQGKFSPVEWKKCICCEKNTVGPRPSDTWSGQFCQPCRSALGKAVGTHIGRIDFLRNRLKGRDCIICGERFIPAQEGTRVCSDVCYGKTEEYKAAKRAYKAKRRAKAKTNGPWQSIDPVKVFERDGWGCYLCGIDTPKHLRGTHDPQSPEMDHIRPISRDGTHTWDNVACACRKCNQKKSAQQVMLIGERWHLIPDAPYGKAVWLQTFDR